MKKQLKHYLLFGIPIVLIVIYLSYGVWFDSWRASGYVKPSLDPQYVPTAEYLLLHPAPTPDFLRVNPSPGSSVKLHDEVTVSLPFKPKSPLGDVSEIFLWTQIFINVQRTSYTDWNPGLISSLDGPDSGYTAYFTFRPDLKPGIHILEIQVGKSITVLFNPAEAYTYTWAYRVE